MKMLKGVLILMPVLLLAVTMLGQNVAPLPVGIDISGSYFPARNQDVGLGTAAGMLVDYGGIPINEAGRIYAITWPANRMTVREQQCMGYVPPYMYIAPGNFRFWQDKDPYTQRLLSIKSYASIAEGERTIYLDDRPHPPATAEHTFPGFATGKFEGDILMAHTTHMKRGWIRANGIPQSDQADLVEWFIRHGDRITHFSVVTDPVYLAEPMSKTFVLARSVKDPTGWLYACDDADQILTRNDESVPQFLYGQNPYVREYADKYKIPLLGALGGPETMYPEFLTKVKTATDAEAMAKILPAPGRPKAAVVPDPTPNDGEIHTQRVRENVYMLTGDGANIVVQTGPQGILVVDTGAGKLADKVVAAIQKLSPDQSIQFVMNTSFYPDHTGGNVKVHLAGADLTLFGGNFGGGAMPRSATIIAHQNVQIRMDGTPTEGWPADTYLSGRRRKFFNAQGIDMFWAANAITDGDSIIHFRRPDVIVTGDVFTTTRYPAFDVKNGGSLAGEIQALNFILSKTVYEHDEDGGTLIIPGHGYITNEFEVSEYRNMLVLIRDRVQNMINKGATLDQVKAARVTADYDDRYGSNTGSWTTDMFVEAVYNSLKK